MSAEPDWDAAPNLVDLLLEEQRTLSAVDVFSAAHDEMAEVTGRYESLIPTGLPGEGEQFAFRVDPTTSTLCTISPKPIEVFQAKSERIHLAMASVAIGFLI